MSNILELHLVKEFSQDPAAVKTLDIAFNDACISIRWDEKSFLKMSLKDLKGIMIESGDSYHWIYLNFSNYHIAIRYDKDAVFTEKFKEHKGIVNQALESGVHREY